MADRIGIDISVNNQQANAALQETTANVGKLSGKLDELNGATGGAGGKASSGIGQMARQFTLLESAGSQGMRGLVGGLGLVATSAAAAGLAIGGVVMAAKKATELGKLGGESLTVKASFEQMTASVGVSTNELQEMQQAADGTISTLKLLELANYSMIGVTGDVGNAIGNANDQLIEIARAAFKARPSLQSVEFAYQSLVDGIKRVEKRLVDNLGLQVKAREANEKYAEAVGKSVDELTAEEVQLAFLNEVLRAGGILIQQVGGDVATMNDAFSRAEAASTNLKVALGESLAPSVSYVKDVWADFIQGIADSVSPLDTAAEWIKEIADLKSSFFQYGIAAPLVEDKLVEARRELIRLQEEATASGNWEKTTDAMQSVVNWYMAGAAAGRVTEEQFVAASDAIAGVAELSSDKLQEMVDALISGSMSAEQFADAIARMEASAAGAQTMWDRQITALRELAAAQDEVYNDAYEKALRSAVQSLTSVGASYEVATTNARSYASAVADLAMREEAGTIATEDFAYATTLLDNDLAALRAEIKETTKAADDLVSSLYGLHRERMGSAIQSLSEMGASQEAATAAAKAHADELTKLDYQLERGVIEWPEYNYLVGQANAKFDALKDTYRETTGAAKEFHDEFLSTLESLVSSNLSPSFDIEGLAPELSVREDEVDEHYRRLAAIAIRGQEELDKHQTDWADTLGMIPEDVKAKGIAAIQAWAADTVRAYDKGLNFDFINRDALKKRIMEALLAQEMKEQLVAEITAELGGAVSEAQVEAAAGMALGGTPLGQISLGGVTFGPAAEPPDMSAAAGQISDELNKAFKDHVDGQGMLEMTARSIIGADMQSVYAAGKVVGTRTLTGITDAVEQGAPDIVGRLARAIAPSVAVIIEANNRRTGQ